MKAKSFFMIFVSMAVVPLLLAYAVLKFGWFTPGATANGTFLADEVHLSALVNEDTPNWSIVYQPKDKQCDKQCLLQLYGVNQTYVALGKLQKRVQAVVMTKVENNPYPLLTQLDQASNLDSNLIYIADPFGNLILSYPISQSKEQMITTSKAMIADLKKLLNYARIG